MPPASTVAYTADAGWLVSRRADLGWLLLPTWTALLVAVLLPEGHTLSPGGWLLVVLGIDVAHVYATIWRTYLSPAEVMRKPGRYLGLPGLLWAALFLVAWLAPGWFWTVLAYAAVFHFVRQQWGFAALYRRTDGLPGRGPGARLEKWSHYAVTVWPVVWWHAHLPRPFTWFTDSDFIPGLPAWAAWGSLPLALGVVLAHIQRRIASRRWSPGRDLWLLTTALVWGVGILGVGGDAAFTLPNVVHHGVPYVALIWWTGRRLHASGHRVPLSGRLHTPRTLLLFILPLLVLAGLEEWAWDRLMWFDHPELFGDWGPEDELVGVARALVLATLSLPQVTHYALDGLIWKMDGSNPGLAEVWVPRGESRP